MYFKESLPNGLWNTININDTTFEIIVEGDGDFQKVIIRESLPNGIFLDELESNNAILEMWLHKKWLGVCSATIYEKCTEYFIYDLEKLILYPDLDCSMHIAYVKHGWVKDKDSLDGIKLDIEKGTITLKDQKEMSFDEYFN